MKETGSRDYVAVVEGEITKRFSASVPLDIDRTRVRFIQVRTIQNSCMKRDPCCRSIPHGSIPTTHLMRQSSGKPFLSRSVKRLLEDETILVWTSDGPRIQTSHSYFSFTPTSNYARHSLSLHITSSKVHSPHSTLPTHHLSHIRGMPAICPPTSPNSTPSSPPTSSAVSPTPCCSSTDSLRSSSLAASPSSSPHTRGWRRGRQSPSGSGGSTRVARLYTRQVQ